MKHLFALPALLRSASLLVAASPRSFSVNDDVLAFPQYDIHFSEDWTSEHDANVRLQNSRKPHAGHVARDDQHNLDGESSQIGQYNPPPAKDESTKDTAQATMEFDYEYMVMEGQRWLCALPRLVPEQKTALPNGTVALNATQARLDEEKELARAATHGWELLDGMQGNCIYYNTGWWSYRFCYNQGVKQFHQLPPSGSVPKYPPQEDPGVVGFVLGAYSKKDKQDREGGKAARATIESTGESAVEKSLGSSMKVQSQPGYGELVQHGDSTYLVQKLSGGTICDLTGKDRKIEVQFHCNPQVLDRIALIKETSTCAYLMVIHTSRLCKDVAFQPPQKDHPNPVSCSPILADDEVEEYKSNLATLRAAAEIAKAAAAAAADIPEALFTNGEDPAAQSKMIMVGDIILGAHEIVPPGYEIEKSAIVGGGKEIYVDTLVSSTGSRVLNRAQLEKLGIKKPDQIEHVEKLVKQLERAADGRPWRLDVFDTPRGREFIGIHGEEAPSQSGDDSAQKEKDVDRGKQKNHDDAQKAKQHMATTTTTTTVTAATTTYVTLPQANEKQKKQKKAKDEGSEEEFFRQEL